MINKTNDVFMSSAGADVRDRFDFLLNILRCNGSERADQFPRERPSHDGKIPAVSGNLPTHAPPEPLMAGEHLFSAPTCQRKTSWTSPDPPLSITETCSMSVDSPSV